MSDRDSPVPRRPARGRTPLLDRIAWRGANLFLRLASPAYRDGLTMVMSTGMAYCDLYDEKRKDSTWLGLVADVEGYLQAQYLRIRMERLG